MKKEKYIVLLLLLFIFAIGYALIESNLQINGYGNIKNSSFDVHFENITVTNGSVEINTTAGDSAALISPTNNTRIDYTITLSKPGDFYEFTVKAVNSGSLDAMVHSVTSYRPTNSANRQNQTRMPL